MNKLIFLQNSEVFQFLSMDQFGLIGKQLGHSFSPKFFKEKFEKEHIKAAYHAFELSEIDQVIDLIKKTQDLRGLNVTIPYKESIIPYLDELDPGAAKIGAVNCIQFLKNGKLKGYNTDIIGFTESLKPLLKSYHQRALILGSGGASKAVAQALNNLSIQYKIVSRNGLINYTNLQHAAIESHTLIINTTPLGMFPDIDSYPQIPYEALTAKHLIYDLVYNPVKTKLMTMAESKGAVVKNGYEMLVLQAEVAWKIWNAEN